MPGTETPAFSYLQAELGARVPEFRGIDLPVITRAVFGGALNAPQEISRLKTDLVEYKPAFGGELGSFGTIMVPNFSRIAALETQIRRAADLLLAMREGYAPVDIPDDAYLGVIPERIGIRNFVGGSVRQVATQTIQLEFRSSLPQEASKAVIEARNTKLFYAFLVSSPALYTFEEGSIPAPGTRVFGVVHTHDDLKIRQPYSLRGAEISGGIPLEIVRIESDGSVVASARQAA